jgi:sec-independent protein translocase protein TatB
MPQIGPLEILVVSVLGLIVFGPDKLPEIARTIGAFMRQVRSMAEDVKQEFSDGFDVADEPEDEELAVIVPEEDDDKDSGHPVAEVIESERDAKGSGREA